LFASFAVVLHFCIYDLILCLQFALMHFVRMCIWQCVQ